MLYQNFNRFIGAESGVVTVDFVMLTAAIVGIGMGVTIIVMLGIKNAASTIEPVIQSSEGLAGRLIGAGGVR